MREINELNHTTIGLVQVAPSVLGATYFPYAVGLLQAYYLAHGKNIANTLFLEPIFNRNSVEDSVKKLVCADMVLYSTYNRTKIICN